MGSQLMLPTSWKPASSSEVGDVASAAVGRDRYLGEAVLSLFCLSATGTGRDALQWPPNKPQRMRAAPSTIASRNYSSAHAASEAVRSPGLANPLRLSLPLSGSAGQLARQAGIHHLIRDRAPESFQQIK